MKLFIIFILIFEGIFCHSEQNSMFQQPRGLGFKDYDQNTLFFNNDEYMVTTSEPDEPYDFKKDNFDFENSTDEFNFENFDKLDNDLPKNINKDLSLNEILNQNNSKEKKNVYNLEDEKNHTNSEIISDVKPKSLQNSIEKIEQEDKKFENDKRVYVAEKTYEKNFLKNKNYEKDYFEAEEIDEKSDKYNDYIKFLKENKKPLPDNNNLKIEDEIIGKNEFKEGDNSIESSSKFGKKKFKNFDKTDKNLEDSIQKTETLVSKPSNLENDTQKPVDKLENKKETDSKIKPDSRNETNEKNESLPNDDIKKKDPIKIDIDKKVLNEKQDSNHLNDKNIIKFQTKPTNQLNPNLKNNEKVLEKPKPLHQNVNNILKRPNKPISNKEKEIQFAKQEEEKTVKMNQKINDDFNKKMDAIEKEKKKQLMMDRMNISNQNYLSSTASPTTVEISTLPSSYDDVEPDYIWIKNQIFEPYMEYEAITTKKPNVSNSTSTQASTKQYVTYSTTTIRPNISYTTSTTSSKYVTYENKTTEKPNISYEATSIKPNISYEATSIKPNITYEVTSLKPNITYEVTSLKPNISYEATSIKPNNTYEVTSLKPNNSYEITSTKPLLSYETTSEKPYLSYETTTSEKLYSPYEVTNVNKNYYYNQNYDLNNKIQINNNPINSYQQVNNNKITSYQKINNNIINSSQKLNNITNNSNVQASNDNQNSIDQNENNVQKIKITNDIPKVVISKVDDLKDQKSFKWWFKRACSVTMNNFVANGLCKASCGQNEIGIKVPDKNGKCYDNSQNCLAYNHICCVPNLAKHDSCQVNIFDYKNVISQVEKTYNVPIMHLLNPNNNYADNQNNYKQSNYKTGYRSVRIPMVDSKIKNRKKSIKYEINPNQEVVTKFEKTFNSLPKLSYFRRNLEGIYNKIYTIVSNPLPKKRMN